MAAIRMRVGMELEADNGVSGSAELSDLRRKNFIKIPGELLYMLCREK
jgi:hypothetical protein